MVDIDNQQEQRQGTVNLQEFILSNDLILSTILNHLDVTSIKNVRLVCKSLSDSAAKILGKKTRLRIMKIFDDDTTTPILQIDHNLIRNMYIDFASYWTSDELEEATNRLVPFLSDNHTFIQQLYFKGEEIGPLFTILNIFKFPAIKKIDILLKAIFKKHDIGIAIPSQTRQSLTHISFIEFPYDIIDVGHMATETVNRGFKTMLQSLINSAPNLNSFNSTLSKYYPDLFQCKNIKTAHLTIPCTSATFTLDIKKFNVIMSQMSSTLQEFILESFGYEFRSMSVLREGNLLLETKIMCLPCFPKLEKLTLDRPWRFIEPNRFPILKHLIITGTGEDMMDRCISSLGHVMKTVKTFTMNKSSLSECKSDDNEYGFLLPRKIKPLFPNIVQISYTQVLKSIQTFSNYTNYLQALLKICNQCKIDKLRVIGFKKFATLNHQAAELKYLYEKDTQSIEWRCPELLKMDQGCHSLTEMVKHEEMLMATKTIKSVVFDKMLLGINEGMWTRIGTFVKEHGLPVDFREGYELP